MDLHIRFSFDAPRGAGARLARFFVPPVVLLMAAAGAAYAYSTSWIQAGQPISAQSLKSTLDEGLVPAGSIIAFGGAAAPPGWVLCDGSTYDKTNATYAGLGATIGTTYGSVNGNTNLFKVPDLRGRTTFGMDAMGGAIAGRLTKAAAQGVDGTALGNVGGEQPHGSS